MSEKPFFSVIIPAHNCAAWMRKGLDTIRAQSFKDYELIIVCDACTDNTAEIAREYTDRVIEVENNGSGPTRNVGLEASRGEWLLWMDDDDWWTDSDAFQKIADEIRKAEGTFDVLAFGFFFKSRGYAQQRPGRLYIAIWNKAWRRDFIGETRFPPIAHTDDVGFANATHGKARFRYLDDLLYYYNYMRPGSITHLKSIGKL